MDVLYSDSLQGFSENDVLRHFTERRTAFVKDHCDHMISLTSNMMYCHGNCLL